MTIKAIITMIIILGGVWGSMAAAMIHMQRHPDDADE